MEKSSVPRVCLHWQKRGCNIDLQVRNRKEHNRQCLSAGSGVPLMVSLASRGEVWDFNVS